MLFEKIIESIAIATQNISGKKIEPLIPINQTLFIFGSLIGLKKMKLDENRYINHMGVTFAPSGAGKDLTLSILEEKIEAIKKYADIVEQGIDDETIDESMIIPTKYKVPLLGSVQGAMRVANYISKSNIGSFNVEENEFGSNLNKQTIELLIKLWQSGSTMGSLNVNEKYPPIENLPTNALLFGTLAPIERDDNKYRQLVEVLETGFARRALFFNIYVNEIQLVEKQEENLDELLEKAVDNIRYIDNFYIPNEAKEFVTNYQKKLINAFNKEPTDWNMIKTSNIDKLERLASIISIVNGYEYMDVDSLKVATKLIEISDEHLLSIIKPKQPYLKIYEHLKIVKSRFKTELLDELGIKLTKTQLNEQLEMLKEYAYRNNYELKVTDMMVHLMPLKDSSLDEIIVSVNIEGKQHRGVVAQNKIIKFFGNEMAVESLITSNVDWFSFVHYNGTRKQSNAIPEFNVVAFDIDDGLLLDDAIALLMPYTYIIYTTKSHKVEKNGFVADRFRIVLPLKRVINLNNDRYKEFVKNIATLLDIKHAIDYSAVEISRLWFSNPDAKVYKNVGELLDPICCIPETKTEENVSKAIKVVTNFDNDKRVDGIARYVLTNVATFNGRNNALFWASRKLNEFKGAEEVKQIVYEINSKLYEAGYEPLSETEIERTIFKSLR